MTNYEALKAMSMNTLAGFLASITTCGGCPAYGNCHGKVCTASLLEWLTDESDDDTVVGHSEGQTINIINANVVIIDEAKGGNEMENRTILFQGKEIDVDDEPGETSDMIHHPDHYIWKGTECKKVIEIMTRGLSGAEAYYMGNIIKYLYRYPKKGTLLSDLAKAEEYTKFLRELFMEDGGKA